MTKRLDITDEAIAKAKELLANKKESGYSLATIAKLSGASYGVVCGMHYKRFRTNETGIKKGPLKPEEVENVKRILRDRDFGKIDVSIQDVANMTGIRYHTVYNINCGLCYANRG